MDTQRSSTENHIIGTIGQYRLLRKLGEGFSAITVLAENANGTPCALKVFNMRKANREIEERVRKEANVTRGLSHKHIVR